MLGTTVGGGREALGKMNAGTGGLLALPLGRLRSVFLDTALFLM